MTLTIDDVVTHYVLSSHPKNKAIIDIKDKQTGDLRYIKIRHRLPKFYAVSLVDPVTFEVWAETQVKSASARVKPILLHTEAKGDTVKNDTSVEFRESARICFGWVFTWEGEKYKWVRESRMSNTLECKAIRKNGDICVAQYLPRMLKDEYFGIFSLLGYNMLRCKLTKSRELELIILMSLMTLLDKSNDGGWKKDQISKGVQDDILESYRMQKKEPSNEDSIVPPIAYEDPIPKKAQQKKYKAELLNEQKLQLLLEKEVKRSQKQIQSDSRQHKPSISAGNSPVHSPKASPLPTPSSSSNPKFVRSPVVTRQRSTSALYTPSASNDSSAQNSPTESQHSSNNGRLTKLFGSLSHMKHSNEVTFVDSPSMVSLADTTKTNEEYNNNTVSHYNNHQYTKKRSNQDLDQYNTQHNQLSLPVRYTAAQFTNDFGKLSVQTSTNSSRNNDNPPSLRSIRWNPEPNTPVLSNYSLPQQYSAVDARRPRMDASRRRLSATEHTVYNYHHYYQGNHNRYSSSEYYVHPYQQASSHFDYY